MTATAIWKIQKLQYLCFADRPVLKKIWHGDVSRSSQPRRRIKFYALKIQQGGQMPFGKYIKHDISKIIWT